ncbi:MAG: hypothetical protein ACLQVI_07915 [Polyangiaceae bacterium]
MMQRHTPILVDARRAASFARDLLNVVREVNEWRHERDAFVAMHLDETRRRAATEQRSGPKGNGG